MNRERQLLISLMAEKIGIAEDLLKGINIPDDADIKAFLIDYKNKIEKARAEASKDVQRNMVVKSHEYTAEEAKKAMETMAEYVIPEDALVGETKESYEKRVKGN